MDDCIAVSVMIMVCTKYFQVDFEIHCNFSVERSRIYGKEPVAKCTYRGIVIILC